MEDPGLIPFFGLGNRWKVVRKHSNWGDRSVQCRNNKECPSWKAATQSRVYIRGEPADEQSSCDAVLPGGVAKGNSICQKQ